MLLTTLLADAADHAVHLEHAEVVPEGAGALVTYITALVVFLLALVILGVFVWPKIVAGLDERERKIREEIQAAEDARRQANDALKDYQNALAEARHEANEMIAKARADAKATAEELRARNERELAAMRERAQRDIEAATQAAITELHHEAASLAVSIASKILEREISVDDQRRLVDESLRELKRLEPTGA